MSDEDFEVEYNEADDLIMRILNACLSNNPNELDFDKKLTEHQDELWNYGR